jgi:hypothetical protein
MHLDFYQINSSFTLLLLFIIISSVNSTIIINLNSKSNYNSNNLSPLKYLSYCIDCNNPTQQGSLALALTSKHGLQDYFVTGELIQCIPNHADTKKIINKHDMAGRIVLVNRGPNSMQNKMMKFINTEVLGVIIADNGQCDEEFNSCGLRSGSVRDGGIAAFDDAGLWKSFDIPILIVTAKTGKIILI